MKVCATCTREHDTPFRRCPACRESSIAAQKKHRYGLDRAALASLLQAQNGKCAICAKEMDRPNIDHDHKCCPGRRSCGLCVRGLLCSRCNKLLAFANDDVEIMEKAMVYLVGERVAP